MSLVQRMDSVDAARQALGKPIVFCPSMRIVLLEAANYLSDSQLDGILERASKGVKVRVLGEVA